jgi:hypothetical protein
LYFDKFWINKNKKNPKSSTNLRSEILSYFAIDKATLEFVEKFVDEYLNSLEIEFSKKKIPVKSGAVGTSASKNRLVCIGLAIIAFSPDLFVETGTQNGISAQFAGLIGKFLNSKLKVLSFDIDTKSELVSNSEFERVILAQPVRKNFENNLSKLRTQFTRVLFFHDSDHSYENMYYEFVTVRKLLKPIAILSDDIEMNQSIYKFANSYDLQLFQFSLDEKNAVGIAIDK